MVKISLNREQMKYRLIHVIFKYIWIALILIFLISFVEAIICLFTLPQFLTENLSRIPINILLIVFCVMFLVWYLLSFIARCVVTVIIIHLFFNHDEFIRSVDFVTRFLSLMPTLILGNVIITSLSKITLYSTNNLVNFVIIVTSLVFIGLPSVIQMMIKVLKDFNIQQIVGERILLGVEIERGAMDAIPISSYKASTIVSLGRIFIEGYLALYKTEFISNPNSNILTTPMDISKVFYTLYSTVTIQSNIYLILILFAVACVAHLWALGYISVTKYS